MWHGIAGFTRTGMVAALLLTTMGNAADDPMPARRWVYLSVNLQVDEQAAKAEAILRRAQRAGYNGVLLADYKLHILDRVIDRYFQNLDRLRKLADELKIEIIPAIAPFGYSAGLLTHDPDLAEGLPARAQPFVVRARDGGGLEAVPAAGEPLVTEGFEKGKGDRLLGWTMQDEPGKYTFLDRNVRASGESSLRMGPAEVSGYANCRLAKRVKVRRFTPYLLKAKIRTEGWSAGGATKLFALADSGFSLAHTDLGLKPTQDWTEHRVVLNSLDHDEFGIYAGVWGLGKGSLWIDDLSLEEIAFVNLVRRKDCPLKVTRESGETLEEGRDFEPVRDERMHQLAQEGRFEVWHPGPTIRLKGAAGLKVGDRLLADHFHAVSIHEEQVPISLHDPKVFDLVRAQIDRVDRVLKPKTWMLSHDEIRVGNWDTPADQSAGKLLAANVRRCLELVRAKTPDAEIVIWSDMFDPSHNAVKNYYLVRGDLAGSWEGLDSKVTIMNWNSGKPKESLPWFAGRGHRQILAGYYDGPVNAIKAWRAEARELSGVDGVMYTTWANRYDDLEAFAKAAWGK
jgi:hypothetical protein